MKGIPTFCICMLSVAVVCLAQDDQSDSLAITTYYPAPHGVYKNLMLIPGDQPSAGSQASQPGSMYFNSTEQQPYIHNETQWVPMGSGSSGFRVVLVHNITPDQCDGSRNPGTYANQLCDGLWYQDIQFPEPFRNTPDVLVVLEEVPDIVNSPCAENLSDQFIGFPTNISETGFRLWASGSPNQWYSPDTSTCGWQYREWHTRAVAGYYAAGE